MEQGYLIDTNIAINYLDNKLPHSGGNLIDSISSQISVITRMELLAWNKATDDQAKILQQFISASFVFNLSEPTILKAIELRKICQTKLPDAIIAATAIVHNLTLITSDNGFKNIPQLKTIDPHKL
jgi:predicted nucleic acid-binding protein